MKKRPTNYLTDIVFMMGFVVWVLGGGIAFPQTPGADTPDPPPTVQEEPITSEDPGEVLERGINRRDHRGRPRILLPPKMTVPSQVAPEPIVRDHRQQPKTFTPPQGTTPPVAAPALKFLEPGIAGPQGGTLALPDRYQAPTANLTMVANALRLKHKSLTTLITAAPNLPITKPIEISIGYYSPAGNQRITQSYVRSTGNRFLYNDKEGDGKPRRMTVSITLREQLPNGESATFALPWQANLDPLYDVAIGLFAFDLISKCDGVGKSEILFAWYSPDRQYHKHRFSMRAGSRTPIGQFTWSRSEVSWSHQLFREQMEFYDEDNPVTEMLWACLPSGCGFSLTLLNQDHLLTGKTQLVKGNLKAHNDDCEAYYEYQMNKTLRWYPELPAQ